MNVEITGRHLEVTQELREFVAERLQKLNKLLDVSEAHVVLTAEKHRQLADIVLRSRTVNLNGQEETDDIHASIRAVVEKLERQALKHKEKLKDHKGSKFGEAAARLEEQALEERDRG